jgi:hypothetical protein
MFYSSHETKLFGVSFNHVSCISIFNLKVQWTSKSLENFKSIFFFSFNFYQNYISACFFEYDESFFNVHFSELPTYYIYKKIYFSVIVQCWGWEESNKFFFVKRHILLATEEQSQRNMKIRLAKNSFFKKIVLCLPYLLKIMCVIWDW